MENSLYNIPLKSITGSPTSLKEYSGKVMLVVNVASECGLTPQYEGLERLYREKRGKGLVVLGFPANEFGAQEPGTNAEIQTFCQSKFGIEFPMFEKIVVKGPGIHPLYAALTGAQPSGQKNADSKLEANLKQHGLWSGAPGEITWNFEKFLIGRDGKVKARFAPDVKPEDPILLKAIDEELGN